MQEPNDTGYDMPQMDVPQAPPAPTGPPVGSTRPRIVPNAPITYDEPAKEEPEWLKLLRGGMANANQPGGAANALAGGLGGTGGAALGSYLKRRFIN